MEDEAVMKCGESGTGFVGVFDGHGGSFVSKFVSKQLVEEVEESKLTNSTLPEEGKEAMVKAFISCDAKLREESSTVRLGGDATKIGATGVSCFINRTHLFSSWIGDSRCVLFSNEKCVELTADHKPAGEEEKRRIMNAGGNIIRGRINGELAVARSFGDFFYKEEGGEPGEQMVSCVPEVVVRERSEEVSGREP